MWQPGIRADGVRHTVKVIHWRKRFLRVLALSALISLRLSAADWKGISVDPVGPAPESAVDSSKAKTGWLEVYTPLEVNDNDYQHPRHASYLILNREGRVLKRVRNHAGSFAQEPERVQIAAGTYTLVRPAARRGRPPVPIVVQPNQTTLVRLEGSNSYAATAR